MLSQFLDEWADLWRFGLLIICLISLYLLIQRYRTFGSSWNKKTHDYWFSLLMWCLAGAVAMVQGAFLNYTLGPSLVFTTAAALASLRGLLRSGKWGGNE